VDLKRTRRRGAELEDAILDAAWDVLVELGSPGFTYEAVAARAHTSRPVLYRRWPQRDDLLRATIVHGWRSAPVPVPDTGSLRDDALRYLRDIAASRTSLIAVISVQLLDFLRETGSTFSDMRRMLGIQDGPTPLETMVARAVERGELPDVPRSRRVVNLAFDLIRHDVLMTMREVPDETIVEIVDDVWLPLVSSPGGSPHRAP
jgi:AcrR family transcriptional regulator